MFVQKTKEFQLCKFRKVIPSGQGVLWQMFV